MNQFVEELRRSLKEAESLYYRLVLLTGSPSEASSDVLKELVSSMEVAFINVNLALSERLLQLSQRQRILQLGGLLDELLAGHGEQALVLGHIEVLFSPELKTDPLRLLQTLSRKFLIVAQWPGEYDGRSLTYAEVGHPEYRHYTRPEVTMVSLQVRVDT